MSLIPFVHLQWEAWSTLSGFTPYVFVVAVIESPSYVWLFATPLNIACQAPLSFTIFQSLLKLMSIELVMLSNHLILWWPFSSCPQTFPALGSFPTSQLFLSGGQSIGASASVFPMSIQSWLIWLVWSLCCPRDSQESSPAPRFKSIRSSALSLLTFISLFLNF